MEVDERDREFEELVENLRGALMPKGGKGKVWLFGAERKDFRILLVDKVSPNVTRGGRGRGGCEGVCVPFWS